jgi:hypothetical protein
MYGCRIHPDYLSCCIAKGASLVRGVIILLAAGQVFARMYSIH